MMCTCGGSRKRGAHRRRKVQIRLPNPGTAQTFCIYESQAHASRPSVLLSFGLAGRALQYRRYNAVDLSDLGATRQPHGL